MNALRCEHHPDREASLAVDLPSLKIQRYLCAECKAALQHLFTAYKGRREAWELNYRIQDEQAPDGRYVYDEMSGWYQAARKDF